MADIVLGAGNVQADGQAGGGTSSDGVGTDGAGGGGGGGGVVIRARSLSGISAQARGGNGGNTPTSGPVTTNDFEGGGGGGGGGYIATSGGRHHQGRERGRRGVSFNPKINLFPTNGGTKGAAGKSSDTAANLPLCEPAALAACGNRLVMVTNDGAFGTGFDAAKKTLFESMGYTVTALLYSAAQAAYDTAAAANEVMFLSNSIGAANQAAVAGKARTEGLGVVSEDQNAWQNLMYLGSGGQGATAGTAIDVLSNTHPITQPFATGALTVYWRWI